MMLRIILLAFFLSPMSLAWSADKLVVAVPPSGNPQELTTKAKEIEDVLEKKLGQDVEILFPTNYAGVVEALRFGHAQVAFMGAWPALLAENKADARVILAEIREVRIGKDAREEPYYFSYFIVKPDSPYKTLQDLKGKKAAFPSPMSSSGYVAPMARMVELGLLVPQADTAVDPKQFFSDVLFSGGYAQGYEALKAGQVDVSVMAGDVAASLYDDAMANTRIIETQGPIPSHTIVVAKDVSPELEAKIKEAFLEFNKPEYRSLMRRFVSGIFVRFIPAGREHVAQLMDMVKASHLEFVEKK